MEREKIIIIGQNPEDKPNKDLIECRDILFEEFTKTKDLIIELTRHLDLVAEYYENINKEIGKRIS